MQKWNAGEAGSAGLESSVRASGARPRKEEEEKEETREEVAEEDVQEDVQGCDQAAACGHSEHRD